MRGTQCDSNAKREQLLQFNQLGKQIAPAMDIYSDKTLLLLNVSVFLFVIYVCKA